MVKLLDRVLGRTAQPGAEPVQDNDSDGDDANVEADAVLRELLDRISLCAERHLQDWAPIEGDGVAYIFNNQLRHITVLDGQSRIQDNQIFPAITQEQALTNQNRVTIKALPFEKSDTEAAKLWEPILQYQYESELDMPGKTVAAIIDAKTHGHWVLRTTWNPKARWDREKQEWVGHIESKLCRPEMVCFAPDCESPDTAPWVIEYDRMRMADAKAEFPEFEDEIDEASGNDEPQHVAALDYIGNTMGGGDYEDQPDKGIPVEGRLATLLAPPEDDDTASTYEDYVWVTRFFVKDNETHTVNVSISEFDDQVLLDSGVAVLDDAGELVNAKTGELVSDETRPAIEEDREAPKYPSYRYVCRVGDTVVKDESWELDEHPYSLGVNLPLPHTWHGLNGVEMVRGLQDVTNRIAMNMEAWVRYFGSPIIAVEENAVQGCTDLNGVSRFLKIKPCAIWKMTANSVGKVKLISPPPMPSTVPAVREMFLQTLRDQTGVQEIGLGRQTTGGATATEAIRLETNTKLRTALQWKMIEIWILRVMRRAQAICQKHFSPDEIRRIAGPGAESAAAKLTAEQFDARFDLRLEVATAMPFDRERRKEEAIALYGVIGVPFLPQLLDAFERPDKDEILAANDAHQMIQAMLERQKQTQDETMEQLSGQGVTSNGENQKPTSPAAVQAGAATNGA